ncbi:hypothetical protein FHS49_003857 [Sphingobium boeckii]|uniref:Uncharacterized protein n=1 Tax=Sphingobium boeckii TaxID=1082345 RepID=A0A7W9ALQ5_9SPHN|nr:hypothetical protein [Sphingobium boeckii]
MGCFRHKIGVWQGSKDLWAARAWRLAAIFTARRCRVEHIIFKEAAMFVAVYSWRVVPGKEERFRRA